MVSHTLWEMASSVTGQWDSMQFLLPLTPPVRGPTWPTVVFPAQVRSLWHCSCAQHGAVEGSDHLGQSDLEWSPFSFVLSWYTPTALLIPSWRQESLHSYSVLSSEQAVETWRQAMSAWPWGQRCKHHSPVWLALLLENNARKMTDSGMWTEVLRKKATTGLMDWLECPWLWRIGIL